MKFYKIQNIGTGLFSRGGQTPKWSKKGKIWQGLGPLKNHLILVDEKYWSYSRQEYYGNNVEDIYKNCVILEYDMENAQVKTHEINEFYKRKNYR